MAYFRSIIDVVADRHLQKGLNMSLTRYFQPHCAYLRGLLGDVIKCLPGENQLFIEIFMNNGIFRSAKMKVCRERLQIRAGATTVEAARTRIPRRDLEIQARRRKRMELRRTKDRKPLVPTPVSATVTATIQN